MGVGVGLTGAAVRSAHSPKAVGDDAFTVGFQNSPETVREAPEPLIRAFHTEVTAPGRSKGADQVTGLADVVLT